MKELRKVNLPQLQKFSLSTETLNIDSNPLADV